METAEATQEARHVNSGERRLMARSVASPGTSSPPTIRTVAKRAGVAVSTVSRVINGGSASQKVQEKVNAAIRELSFRPSMTAQALVTRRSACVGLVVNSSRGSWFSQLIGGVEEALGETRRSVLLASLQLSGEYDCSVVNSWIAQRRVDGLVFVRCSERERPLVKAATKAGIPVALIAPDRKSPAAITVCSSNIQAGQIIAEYLLNLGHRTFAFAGGPRESRDSRDRLSGVRRALAERGLALAEERVWHAPSYYSEAGSEYAQRFLALSKRRRASAVILASDAMAMGFLRTVSERGLSVPKDVSVASFDGIPEGALVWPGLTTVSQPSHDMARDACRALIEQIDSSPASRNRQIVYDVQLIVRESCASPSG